MNVGVKDERQFFCNLSLANSRRRKRRQRKEQDKAQQGEVLPLPQARVEHFLLTRPTKAPMSHSGTTLPRSHR